MPTFIQHRVNLPEALHDCDPRGGVEIDIRSSPDIAGALYLSHDPWAPGAAFDRWLQTYSDLRFQGPLVLNTKEDGLEGTLVTRLKAANIDHYFFLDTTPPTLTRCLHQGWGAKMSVRMSRYEPPAAVHPWFDATLMSKAPPGWLWVDCFHGVPLARADLTAFVGRAKLCLVSPELQQQPVEAIKDFTHLIDLVDAICTKSPSFWHAEQRAQPNNLPL